MTKYAIMHLLLNDANLITLVGDKIYLNYLPENLVAFPSIIIRVDKIEDSNSKDIMTSETVTLSCIVMAATNSITDSITQEIFRILHDLSELVNTSQGTVKIIRGYRTDYAEDYDEDFEINLGISTFKFHSYY